MTPGRRPARALGVPLLLGALVLAPLAAGAGTGASEPQRTAWGDPDLQGVWDFRTITPMERPAELAGKALLTAAEAASFEARENRRQNRDLVDPERGGAIYPPASAGGVVPYNEFWYDRGSALAEGGRTSLIVDPPDGRLPPLVPGAPRQGRAVSADVAGERPVRFRSGGIGADGPEDRALGERCLLGFNAGPPVIPSAYNNTLQVFQTPDHVVILNEMIHDARIVPLAGRRRLPPSIRQWMGDSRGRWEGDTLVVETTNFTDRTASFNPTIQSAAGTGATLHLVERLTRTGAGTLALRVHRRRPPHLHAAVHGRHSHDDGRRAALRIRLPRGQLRDVQPAGRRPRAGGAVTSGWREARRRPGLSPEARPEERSEKGP